jgi:hypothetical protein
VVLQVVDLDEYGTAVSGMIEAAELMRGRAAGQASTLQRCRVGDVAGLVRPLWCTGVVPPRVAAGAARFRLLPGGAGVLRAGRGRLGPVRWVGELV